MALRTGTSSHFGAPISTPSSASLKCLVVLQHCSDSIYRDHPLLRANPVFDPASCRNSICLRPFVILLLLPLLLFLFLFLSLSLSFLLFASGRSTTMCQLCSLCSGCSDCSAPVVLLDVVCPDRRNVRIAIFIHIGQPINLVVTRPLRVLSERFFLDLSRKLAMPAVQRGLHPEIGGSLSITGRPGQRSSPSSASFLSFYCSSLRACANQNFEQVTTPVAGQWGVVEADIWRAIHPVI